MGHLIIKQFICSRLRKAPREIDPFLILGPSGLPFSRGHPSLWLLTQLGLRPKRPFTGVSGPSGPEIPKKSRKSLPGPPGPECPKSLEKSRKVSKKCQRDFSETFLRPFDSFRDFLDTPGREAWGDFFETFWGFRAQRARRLL